MYKKRITQDEFIDESTKIHNGKYDYSKVTYINKTTKVCIICPEHGEFWQIPKSHLNGCGCFKCSQRKNANKQKKITLEDFINKARKVHGNKYDYSKVEYKKATEKVCIICPIHGEFWQTPNDHLSGYGCNKCGFEKVAQLKRKSVYEFIENAKKVHGDKYDYSKVEYLNGLTKVCIICPEHGEFWQTPSHHLTGQGCPICSESKLEKKVRVILDENNIHYEKQKTFSWLISEKNMKLDFYLPDYNIAIECQGIQHYRPIDFAGKGESWAKDNFKYIKRLDRLKKDLCQKNSIKILYFKYNDNIINLKNKLL